MASESKVAIFAAISGNIAIAVTKFIAAFFTGSSAMLSEGIHSIVDTGNGWLLLFGLSQSQKPPDIEHPFGHGKELYFWSLIVAITIFAVGGGVSLYEGISHLRHPQPTENILWSYLVLGFAFIFEGTSWLFGWKAFRKTKGDRGILRAIHTSKDPSNFIVVFEDSGALLGLVIAFCGVFFGRLLDNPYLDGVASIVIGVMLGLMATFLAYESKGLLIGEGVERETLRSLRSLIERDSGVEKVASLLTMYFGPHEVMLVLDVRFRRDLSAAGVRSAIARLKRIINDDQPDITRIFFAVESVCENEEEEENQQAAKDRNLRQGSKD